MGDKTETAQQGFGFALNDSTLALAALAVFLSAAVLWSARGANVEKTDFALTYVGAHIVHTGMGRHLYDVGLQVQLRDAMFQHPSPLYFEHPPFEAVVLSPLAAVSFRTAHTTWGLCNVAILLAAIVWLRRYLPWPSEDIAYLFLWLLFAPLLVAIYQGQSSIVVLAAYAAAFVQLRKGNTLTAGVVFGLALLKFQFAVPFAAIFLLRKQWRFVAGFSAVALGLATVSLIGVGWSGATDYVRLLMRIGSNPQNISYGSAVDMPTLHGLLYAIAGPIGPSAVNIAVAVLSVALLAWVAGDRPSRSDSKIPDHLFAASIAASLLCGSHMFTHDFSPLALGMFVAGTRLAALSRGPRITLGLTLVVFWMFPLYFLFVKWHCLYLMAAVLLLFTWGCVQGGRSTGRDAESAELQPVAAQ